MLLFGSLTIFSIFKIAKANGIRSKIKWSYPLVFSFLFLISYFAFSMTCHASVPFCTSHAAFYSIPLSIIGSVLFGYVLLPKAYLFLSKTFISKKLSLELPSYVPVYIANSGKPFAYSYKGFGKWIVISQAMIDILTKKELQAVLLHEYGHLLNNSSIYKGTSWAYSKVPIIQAFFNPRVLENEEENRADLFSIKTQGTKRYLNAAKRKVKDYFGC
ncbi:MAG: M48 family metalloprotease [Candidatus Micrarchaeota archaeon]